MRLPLLVYLLPALALGALLAVRFGPGLLAGALHRFVARRAGTGPFTSRYTTQRNVMVPMRDGIRLATDFYRPQGPGPFPVILIRLPYGKGALGALLGGLFARYGYLVVVQDTRGRYDSEGEFYPWVHEQADGHDTTTWVAAQPWCNGHIGTLGASYFGYTQWALAADSPQVQALLPIFTCANIYGVHYQGGAFFELGLLQWGLENCGRRTQPWNARHLQRGLAHWPLIEADDAALRDVAFFDDWVTHPTPDAYWAASDVSGRIPAISAPMFLVAGWYDIFNVAQLEDWQAIQAQAQPQVRAGSKLLIGPWNHTFANKHQKGYGIAHPPSLVPLEIVGDWKRWLDYALKGEANGWDARAPVRLYVLGENAWRDEQEWPLARAVYTDYYLHSGGQANSTRGDGTLDTRPPAAAELADAYTYDPLQPVPTRGGANYDAAYAGPADQRAVEARSDVLVYSTGPLERPVEVTGPVRLLLHAASDAPDTDWTAKLVDVLPDGRAILLCDGILRARYRRGLAQPELLEPGAAYEFDIAIGNTSVLFQAGHRIRLEISSSNFPRFSRNPNTGTDVAAEAHPRPAQQRVYHDAAHPSRLVLPVIPR